MNLWHLKIFRTVAEVGNITKASERLGVTQPAVTRELRTLERELGTQLFDRLPRGVRLTVSGQVLFQYAQRIGLLEREAEASVRELETLRGGSLDLVASTTIGNYILPRLVALFHRRHPEVRVSLAITNSSGVHSALAGGEAEAGFVEGETAPPEEFAVRAFDQDELVPVIGASHPLNGKKPGREALEDQTFLVREPGSGTREVVLGHLTRIGVTPRDMLCLGSTEAIKDVLASGVAVSLVSRRAIADELTAGTLRILGLAELVLVRQMTWLVLKRRRPSPALTAFLRIVRESHPVEIPGL
jgi:DNA-binding transcriptional LysR family regulator